MARDLCQATTHAYKLINTLQITCPNIHIRIFIDFDFKISKIGKFTKQFNSKAIEHEIDVRNSYLTTMKAIDIDVSSRNHL